MCNDLTRLKLALQRSLLGEVTPSLIGVTAGFCDSGIKIIAYFDETFSDYDEESIQMAGSEVIGDFPNVLQINEECIVATEKPLEMLDFWAFMRKRAR